MEPVYGTVIQLARLVWRVQGLKFTVTGVENLPATGGAVIAINHTSYFDFTFAGLPAYKQDRGRKVRFMAKKEVFDTKITGPIMRSLRHIPVDRGSGAASFDAGLPRAEGRRVGRGLPRGDDQPQLRDQGVQVGRGADGDRRRRADRPAHRLGRPAHLDQGPSEEHVAAQGADLRGGRRADRPDAAAGRADRAAAFADAASARTRAGRRTGRIRPASSGCRTGWAAERPRWPRPNRMDADEAAEKAGQARASSRPDPPEAPG